MKLQRQESGRENRMLQSWSLQVMVCGLSQACAISFFSHWGYADRAHLRAPLPASGRYSPNTTLLCGGGLLTPTPWCVSLWNSGGRGMLSLSPRTAPSAPSASSAQLTTSSLLPRCSAPHQPAQILSYLPFLAKGGGCGGEEVAVSTCVYKGRSLVGVRVK